MFALCPVSRLSDNGPADCFSRRNPTQAPGTYPGTPRQRGQKTVTVQGGYGALFAVMVQILLSITRDRGTNFQVSGNL